MKFYLEVQGGYSDIILWLPSDFRGHIHHSSPSHKPTYSPGFANRILPHVRINEEIYDEDDDEDEVVVRTMGKLSFKMWDIATGAPERKGKETWRRMLKLKKSSESTIDWDFLLED
jgi:hypothetical protein